jgi:membrane protein DedA with SNARE-associated domain/membrane-associated phospholipid phosphatase
VIAWLALAVVFLVPALEASAFVGFVFPGELAILLGGVLAYQGRVELWQVLVAAIAGAVIGDSVGYLVGKRWGHAIVRGTVGHLPLLGRHLDENLERARAYLHRRGAHAVVVGRFTAGLRVTVPGLAGMSDMHYPTFLAANALGGAVWATAFVLLGFFAGAAWRRVEGIASKVGLGLLAVLVVGLVAHHLWRRRHAAGARLASSPPAAWFRRRFPRTAAWLGARVATGARGYSLTLVVAVGALAAWAFGGLTQDVVAGDEMALVDPRVTRWLVDHRVGWATMGAKVSTWLGSTVVLIPVIVAVGLWFLWRRRTGRPALLLGLALGGAIVWYDLVKAIVARPRPPVADQIGVTVTGWSFPSGHATQSLAVYGMLAVILIARLRRGRIALGLGATLIVLVVGWTRLYLGVHWLTDVLGGWSLGLLWLCALVAADLLLHGRPGEVASEGARRAA